MTDNNRNPDQQSGSSTKQNQNSNQSTQNTSNQREQNPQKGAKWSNYRSREMSDEGYSRENTAEQENK